MARIRIAHILTGGNFRELSLIKLKIKAINQSFSNVHNMALQLKGLEGVMHIAALSPHSLRHAACYKKHKKYALICSLPALLDNTMSSLTMCPISEQPARRFRSVRALARASPDEDSDEDLMDWEEDEDGLEVEEFDNVTIKTGVEDGG